MHRCEIVEAVLNGLVESDVVSLPEILTAVSNLFSNGTIIEQQQGQVTDKQLRKLYEGFDKSRKALDKMMTWET